ncbi:choice-of-anchor D domain-containing protein [Alicycliphilus denitrificans]|uniref:Choice-of-anchor D domain-containing protein n=1 Tax=Alicycliphilus denitrificans TaxID=179636 RepID=A0A420KFC1_9BURK|nr:choice-of-anchor D domain-containing protein [Alicycliphilus denitrificans]RKJ98596.1 choice-of-anchor D domain-containing protein [Alicycliphilus denitrificans]
MKLRPFRAAVALTTALTTAAAPLLAGAQTYYEYKSFKPGLVVNGTGSGSEQVPSSGGNPQAPQPALQLSTTAINFGDVATHTTETRQVLVSNPGTGPLTFTTAPAVTGAAEFSAGLTSCGSTLAAGADCLAEATFSPTATGTFKGVLSFTSMLANSPHEVTLVGTAFNPIRQVALTSANPSLNFGWQVTGSTPPVKSWVFQNRGNVPMTLGLSGLPAGVSQQNGCVDVASYASCTISLSLDTTVERTIPATAVSFTGDWSTALAQALSVEGGVAASGFKQVTAPVSGLSFTALTFHQGLFYSVMYGANPVVGTGSFLYASADGKNWSNKGRIQSSAQPANGIAFSASGRILVAGLSSGSTGGKVAVSDDGGSTWSVTLSTGGLGQGVAVNDAGVALFTTVNVPQGYRSTNNGTSWVANAVSDNSSGSRIVSNGGSQFATLNSGSLRYSLDSGASWTQVFAGGGNLRDLMFIGNQVWFVGSGGGAPGRVCYATLGVSSTPTCSLISGSPTLTALTAGNGVFVVGTSTSNLAYKSTDGTTWSPITGLPDWPTLAYGNGLYVGVRSQNAYVAVEP